MKRTALPDLYFTESPHKLSKLDKKHELLPGVIFTEKALKRMFRLPWYKRLWYWLTDWL